MAGLPLSTTHRQVGELTRWGALERRGDNRNHIGLRQTRTSHCRRAGTPRACRLRQRRQGLGRSAPPLHRAHRDRTEETAVHARRHSKARIRAKRPADRARLGIGGRPGTRPRRPCRRGPVDRRRPHAGVSRPAIRAGRAHRGPRNFPQHRLRAKQLEPGEVRSAGCFSRSTRAGEGDRLDQLALRRGRVGQRRSSWWLLRRSGDELG